MKSTSVFKKLAIFVIVLSLVLSAVGTALADNGEDTPGLTGFGGPNGGHDDHHDDCDEPKPDTVNVVFDPDYHGAEKFTVAVAVIDKDSHHPKATFTLPTITRDGFDLLGWSLGAAGATVTVGVDYSERHNKWQDIEVEACWMRVELTEYYNVYYTGTFIDGCLFWPADVEDATTAPVIAGYPYRAGYYFSGWRPGTLDWATAEKVVDDHFVPGRHPHIERTITYTIHVEGSFTLDPVPTTPTTEVPVAAPQTGGIEWAGIAGVLAVVSALGIALIVRRRNDA
jgi:hypothetical protein